MNWFTKLIKSKIHITIVTPPPEGVNYSKEPKVIIEEAPTIRRYNHSNLRFVKEQKTDCYGVTSKEIYSTEYFTGTRWSCIPDSISLDYDKAIDLHLRLLNSVEVGETKLKTIVWEGLNAEEAKSWSELTK